MANLFRSAFQPCHAACNPRARAITRKPAAPPELAPRRWRRRHTDPSRIGFHDPKLLASVQTHAGPLIPKPCAPSACGMLERVLDGRHSVGPSDVVITI